MLSNGNNVSAKFSSYNDSDRSIRMHSQISLIMATCVMELELGKYVLISRRNGLSSCFIGT